MLAERYVKCYVLTKAVSYDFPNLPYRSSPVVWKYMEGSQQNLLVEELIISLFPRFVSYLIFLEP